MPLGEYYQDGKVHVPYTEKDTLPHGRVSLGVGFAFGLPEGGFGLGEFLEGAVEGLVVVEE